MRLAKEGIPFVVASDVLALAAVVFAATRPSLWLWLLAAVLLIVAGWVVYFFRDPEREGDRGDRLVISPADGKIVMITEVDEPAFIRGRAIRISVFMNIFSVHVNRYPVSGTVEYVQYNPGKFLNAAAEKSSLDNEQMSVGIESPLGRIVVRQIAGLIARRIVTYSRHGDLAAQGARFGIIRFGSRVDIFVPTTCGVRVHVGQQASAGLTILAEG
ncbi:MAG: phosphatidylserine decarboxylase family protein [Gemmatimonadetes bacterium]|nr:phosphatidylserine decarboxylase family protein [Gemmatimonadota bacterium]